MAQRPDQLTLHVMSVRSEQSLRELIAEHGWQRQAAYYKAQRKSGDWFVLLYGQYDSPELAEKERAALQKKLRIKDVLIRNIVTFQKDITSR